jgi:hypothetical protein
VIDNAGVSRCWRISIDRFIVIRRNRRRLSLIVIWSRKHCRQRNGITVVHDDVAADASNNLSTREAIHTRSFVSVPLSGAGGSAHRSTSISVSRTIGAPTS